MSPLGLGPTDPQDWRPWLEQRQNKGACALAMVCWSIMLLWVFFSIWSVASPANTPERSVETSTWMSGGQPLPELFVKTRDENLTIVARSCAIYNGDLTGYAKNKYTGIAAEGGCDTHKLDKRSHLFDKWAHQGGCMQFVHDAKTTFKDCWKLQASNVVGQFGSPEFLFTRILVYVPDPASHLLHIAYRNVSGSSMQERMQSLESRQQVHELRRNTTIGLRVIWKDHFTKSLGDGEQADSYTSDSIKTSCHETMTAGRFFRFNTLRQFGSLGAELFLTGVRQSTTDDPGGKTTSWTAYDGEYTDTSRLETDDKFPGQLMIMEINFRATPMKDEITERPRVTWFELPQVCGGFFTGFVLLISGLSTRFAWLLVVVFNRATRRAAGKNITADH